MTTSPTRFGVSRMGHTFTWVHLGDDLEPVEETYRAHPGFSFDDQISYQGALAIMQAQAQLESAQMTKRMEELTKRQEAGEIDDVEMLEAAKVQADEQLRNEQARFVLVVDQTLMLVHPGDRERLHPHLSQGNSLDVRELRNYLQDVVVARTVKDVEVVGGVDPTSPSPPAGS